MELLKVPIHRAGHKKSLLLGGDRELVLVVAIFSAALIFSGQTLLSALTGVGMWLFSIYFLRKLAKWDPDARKAYLRSLSYAKYYPARATPYRSNTASQKKKYK